MLLKKLPQLKSGEDPTQAFAGTFHFDESYTEFQSAYDEARAGKIPSTIPAAMYSLCIEVKSPQDVEKDVSLPRGNIFQKDLSMPFREDGTAPSWGVETEFKNIFLCGAGAIRGGGVSGIPGHNAAAAVLEAIKG